MRSLSTHLAVLALGASLAGGVAVAQAPQPSAPVWVTRPCQSEDSVDCHWDAGSMGNGGGHSFVVRQVPGSTGMTCVFYTQRKFARHHDYCS